MNLGANVAFDCSNGGTVTMVEQLLGADETETKT